MKTDHWKVKMDSAKFRIVQRHPFFACLLLRMRILEDPHCSTMWTDGTRIGFSPKFVDSCTTEEVQGVLVHELLHVAGMHMTRRKERQPRRWNVACDHVINGIVLDAGLELPEGGCPPIKGKLPEEIYHELPEDGSGGDGYGPGGYGEVRDAANADGTALTKEQAAELESKIGVVVRQAANAARAAGKLPAGLERMVDEILEPKIPWRDVLARFVTEKALNDWSWARPNRRYMPLGLFLPAPDGVTIARGAVACDTSGSMDQEMLREVCSEALGLLSMYEGDGGSTPELDLYWFDHACHHQQVSEPSDIKPIGGGGTSFACVFNLLKDRQHRPAWLVMLTDGYCDDFGEDPGVPVLWILTKQRVEKFTPPFGEVAHLID